MDDTVTIGRVLAIAVRTSFRGPMRELPEARISQGGGIEGDLQSRPDRGVTLIASAQWAQVQEELGVEIPWHTRRANILIESAGLGHLIEQTLAVGDVQIRIVAE